MHTQQRPHAIHAYQEGEINTFFGFKVNLQAPLAASIDVNDVASALSKICRFGGHTSAFYSVAQHSVLVAALAPDYLKKEALMHDAAESYIGDVVKPLKHLLGPAYANIESQFEMAISDAFGIDLLATAHQIAPYDLQALEMEHEALQNGNPGRLVVAMTNHSLSTDDRWAWSHEFARRIFKIAYHDYFNL